MDDYQSIYTGEEIDAGIGKANTATQPEDLGELAGKDTVDYQTEVTNKPTIPDEVTEETVANWGFTKNTGTYIKPNDGIPKTDLTQEVQTSLGKADTALQQHQDISGKQNITDNTLQTNNKTIPTAINEVNSIAKGANKAVVFTNYSTMVAEYNLAPSTRYSSGNNIYIIQLDVPDLWISSIESSSVTYHYTTDEAFTSALKTNGYVQVGYYKLSALETQKVDLTGYQTLIDSSHKLSADLVDDTSSTNKFVTASDKSTWNNKQNALISGTNIKTLNNLSLLGAGNINAGTKATIDISSNNDDYTQAQIQDIYTNKYDNIEVISSTNTIVLHKMVDAITSQSMLVYMAFPLNVGGFAATIFNYDSGDDQYASFTQTITIPDEVSGTNDGTNWTSLTIGEDTYNIPAGGAPQLLFTKTVDLNSQDDENNPMLFFPQLTQLNPGHYYFVTKISEYYAPNYIAEGVVEFIVFENKSTPGDKETHWGNGSICYWQDGTTPSPTGELYIESTACMMETDYNQNNQWGVYVTFDTQYYNVQFSDGAVIKVYYKPL